VADGRVPQLHGAFVCSDGIPPDSTIAEWKRQHVQTVEVHGTLPFYGRHLPLGNSWPVFADDQWHQLRLKADPEKPRDDAPWKAIHAYVSRKSPGRINVAQINDYIRRLHSQGIYAIMYFNPTEAWEPWIKENYPADMAKDAHGHSLHCWYESNMVCPNPESPWGKHLLREFTAMMDLYPKADGFFMDQSCYDNLDWAHDDGWSIAGGRTGYRMSWAICQMATQCRKLAKARGKFLWWNGPYMVDIASFAEGMMAEAGDDAQVRRIQYLTMGGRACCTLSTSGEEVFQRCAAYGLYPSAMAPPLDRVAQRYWPIFQLFRGKRWVFDAHALTLPPGTEGNVYRLPDGNVLAVMVTRKRSIDGEACDVDLPIVLRLPDAAQFRAAYFLSPDLLGKRRLKLRRQGEEISLVVPRHRSVSAILLACSGDHVSVDGPFEVASGREATALVVLDNLTRKAAPAAPRTPGRGLFNLNPESISLLCPVRFKSPIKKRTLREQSLPFTSGDLPLVDNIEFYIDPPLSVHLSLPDPPFCQRRAVPVTVDVFSPTGAREVEVELSGAGVTVEPAKQSRRVGGRAMVRVPFRVKPARAGKLTLTATAKAGGDGARESKAVEVYATVATPSDLRRVRAGSLLLDAFGSSGGQYENKPVRLNGVRIGLLPHQDTDEWSAAEMPLPPAALAAIGENNEVQIENTVGDCFKIRNLRLRLQTDVSLLSEINKRVFTSGGWAHEEGTVFQLGRPMTGMWIHIPIVAEAK
jgi:hypothetical protein